MLEGKCAETIFIIESVLIIVNSSPMLEPYLWLGECLEKNGEEEKALGIYQTALEIDPYSVDGAQGIIKNEGEIY